MLLTVELVPRTAWGHNVRQEVSRREWDIIRKKCYKAAGYVCEICGGVGRKHPVECHEIWEYDDRKHRQVLTGFVALCPGCHRVKHLGRSYAVGFGRQALRHLAHTNDLSVSHAQEYVRRVFLQWHDRSQHAWATDISYTATYME